MKLLITNLFTLPDGESQTLQTDKSIFQLSGLMHSSYRRRLAMIRAWVGSLYIVLSLLFIASAFAVSDGYFYELSEVAYSFEVATANRLQTETADYSFDYGESDSVTNALPWPFEFYGQTYGQLNASVDGSIWLGTGNPLHSFNLPVSGPVISPWNYDLSSYYYGGVFVQHLSSPERVVVQWQAETFSDAGYGRVNDFQAVLYQDGTIRFNYKTFDGNATGDFGSGISQGDGLHYLNLTSTYGNVSTLGGRSFVFFTPPALTVDPVETPTNQLDQTLSGTMEAGATVSVAVDTAAVTGLVSYPTSTTWTCPITGLVENTNNLTVTATDAVGHNALINLEIVKDTTPPTLTVEPVPSSVNTNYYSLSGTMEQGATVDVTTTAPVLAGPVSYDSEGPGTWSCDLSELAEGANLITVSASDGLNSAALDLTIQHVKADPYTKLWILQDGSLGDEGATAVGTDQNGNLFVGGNTTGDLHGMVNAGGTDGFLLKFDPEGNLVNSAILGTLNNEELKDVSVDTAGNAYVVGTNLGGLDSGAGAGGTEIFLAKFDNDAIPLWATPVQYGTKDDETGKAIAVDGAGNVVVAGSVFHAKVRKNDQDTFAIILVQFDQNGIMQWAKTKSLGLTDTVANMTKDVQGNIYVVGTTNEDLDGQTNLGLADAYLAKFNSLGDWQWTRLVGTGSDDYGYSVTVDSNNRIYVAGETYGTLVSGPNAGGSDFFVVSFDANGNSLLPRFQDGTDNFDSAQSVVVDLNNNILVAGNTRGSFDGLPASSSVDNAFLAKFDKTGAKAPVLQYRNQSSLDHAQGTDVTFDPRGDVVVVGTTQGALGQNPSQGGWDYFFLKIKGEAPPEPEPPGPLSVAINPVDSPTSVGSQTISGTVSVGGTVTVAVDTAAVAGAINYTSTTTWQCTISSLADGINNITVTAEDGVNPSVSEQTSIEYSNNTIVVTKAQYINIKQTLTVYATSERGANANLAIDGFGVMQWDSKQARWVYFGSSIPISPSTVTVSGSEGSVTVEVVIK